mmetsp:Transcript_5959/g.8067  ORF Transcript_5959/g.8067 Transcript_5959/m.8067 type:complete len:95 (-) Transcript_5959:18-302(-)
MVSQHAPSGARLLTPLEALFDEILQEVLVDLDLLGLLAHFDEGADVDRGAVVLHHVVRAVHVHEHVLLLELPVLISGDVVDKGFLRAAEVAAED